MRKVRDYDAELKALEERAGSRYGASNSLRHSSPPQARTLNLETLGGALLDAVASTDADAKGAAFSQGRGRKAGRKAGDDGNSEHRD